MIRPGDTVLYDGAECTVAALELRGFKPNETHWAKVVQTEGKRVTFERWVLKSELQEIPSDAEA
ncbi:MAG: hypothetical protein GTN69_10560 [Armatimonadetes bacterium]|nr:hypothetical protein [Armatimonadota bacterium]